MSADEIHPHNVTDNSSQPSGEAISSASRQPPPESENRERNKRGYFSKFKNWVSLLTLLAVASYTGISAIILCTQRDQEQRQLRAYVMVQSSVFGFNDKGQLSAKITIKNFGSTPAYNVRHWACTVVSSFPEQDVDFPTATEMINSYRNAPGSLIPPSATLEKVLSSGDLQDRCGFSRGFGCDQSRGQDLLCYGSRQISRFVS